MNIFVKVMAALSLAAGLVGMAHAAPLGKPSGEPILEIVGAIESTNVSGAAVFDRTMLEELGLETIVTTTPWHQGQVRFEGVSLQKLMAAVGAHGKTVKAIALNDYVTTIPIEDLADHQPILALKRDGRYMPVRDKGPLFVIYPYDSKAELKSQMYYARSAWQVRRLEVQP
jgi:hypothetical protein